MQPWQGVPRKGEQRQVQLGHLGLHGSVCVSGVNIVAAQLVVHGANGLLVQKGCPVE